MKIGWSVILMVLIGGPVAAQDHSSCYGFRESIDLKVGSLKPVTLGTDGICLISEKKIKTTGWTDVKVAFSMEGRPRREFTGMIEVLSLKEARLTLVNEEPDPPQYPAHVSIVDGQVILTALELEDAQSEKTRWIGLFLREKKSPRKSGQRPLDDLKKGSRNQAKENDEKR